MGINGLQRCTNTRDVTLLLSLPANAVKMRLRNDPGVWGPWEPIASEKPWILPEGDGVKRVCVESRSALWLTRLEACDDILLDTTPPTDVSLSINGGAECADGLYVTLNVTATGADFVQFTWDPQKWSSDWYAFKPAFRRWLGDGRGWHTVWLRCRDDCGNESAVVSDDIFVMPFADIPCGYSAWPYIRALTERGILSGCGASPPRYCPYDASTRAVMAEALCKAAGKTWLDSATPTFADVPRDHPAYGWIERLADAVSWGGTPVTDGCGWQGAQKLFCPDASVTREQAAKFVCRATGRPPMPTCSGIFRDVPSVRRSCGFVERLADAASWPGGVPVTNGCGKSGTTWWYCPDRALTRGEMAVFIVRAFGIPL
jgi:hypothetical protein